MSDYAVTVSLPDHKRGDRWPAAVGATEGRLTIGPVLIDGVTPDASLDRVRFQFVHTSGARYIIDSEEPGRSAPLVIDDEDTWEAHIPETATFLNLVGQWSWDAEFYDGGREAPLTLYKGQITVTSDV